MQIDGPFIIDSNYLSILFSLNLIDFKWEISLVVFQIQLNFRLNLSFKKKNWIFNDRWILFLTIITHLLYKMNWNQLIHQLFQRQEVDFVVFFVWLIDSSRIASHGSVFLLPFANVLLGFSRSCDCCLVVDCSFLYDNLVV